MKFFVKDEQGNEIELQSIILNIEKDDVIVLKSNTCIPAKDFSKIVKSFQSHFKYNDCIGVGPDLDLGIIRHNYLKEDINK